MTYEELNQLAYDNMHPDVQAEFSGVKHKKISLDCRRIKTHGVTAINFKTMASYTDFERGLKELEVTVEIKHKSIVGVNVIAYGITGGFE